MLGSQPSQVSEGLFPGEKILVSLFRFWFVFRYGYMNCQDDSVSELYFYMIHRVLVRHRVVVRMIS